MRNIADQIVAERHDDRSQMRRLPHRRRNPAWILLEDVRENAIEIGACRDGRLAGAQSRDARVVEARDGGRRGIERSRIP